MLHFPPEVYLRRGVGELAPLLVRALHERKISALQFLRGGRVRVTLLDLAYREELLSSDFMFEDSPIPVTPADCFVSSVYLRDLPVEISDESVRSALEVFGDVFSVRAAVHKDFPSIRNGTRILLMSVKVPIPSSLNVLGFVCRTWYPGQPAYCTVCRQPGHLPRSCPLSGLCRRCKQPGHVARECVHARPSSRVSDPPPVPSDPEPSSEDDEDLSSDASEEPEPDPPEVPAPSPVEPTPPPAPVPVPSPAPVSAPSPAPVSVPSPGPVSAPSPAPVSAPSASPPVNVAAIESFVSARLPKSRDRVSRWGPSEIERFVDRIFAYCAMPGYYPVAIAYVQSFVQNVKKSRGRK